MNRKPNYNISLKKKFLKFLKDNNALDLYINNIRQKLVRNHKNDIAKLINPLQDIPYKEDFIIQAFCWYTASGKGEVWHALHKKWNNLL